jgi:hypothetical protein
MFLSEVLERLNARRYDGRLQMHNGVIFQTSSVAEITPGASGRGRQPGIRIDLQVNTLGFSGHGSLLEERHRLRGNPDSSTNRRRPGEYYAVPCRWRNIFRMCNALLSCRTSRKRQDRAWEPPRKTVPERGTRGKARAKTEPTSCHGALFATECFIFLGFFSVVVLL